MYAKKEAASFWYSLETFVARERASDRDRDDGGAHNKTWIYKHRCKLTIEERQQQVSELLFAQCVKICLRNNTNKPDVWRYTSNVMTCVWLRGGCLIDDRLSSDLCLYCDVTKDGKLSCFKLAIERGDSNMTMAFYCAVRQWPSPLSAHASFT